MAELAGAKANAVEEVAVVVFSPVLIDALFGPRTSYWTTSNAELSAFRFRTFLTPAEAVSGNSQ